MQLLLKLTILITLSSTFATNTNALADSTIVVASSAKAGTRASTLSYEAHDGDTITGFIMQSEDVQDDAPIAFLLHGMETHSFHWIADGFPTYGGKVTQYLLEQGYRVIALDARHHGYRKDGSSPDSMLFKAKFGMTSDYYEMIENTVKDYEFVLKRALDRFKDTKHVVAVGYSMGAQQAIMLAANNSEVTHLVTMVPPHTGYLEQVSPVKFAPKIKAEWLLFSAKEDEYSDEDETQELLDAITATKVHHIVKNSGHILPKDYVTDIQSWLVEKKVH